METSPSRSDSFSRVGWRLRCKAREVPSFERLGVDAGLGESFNSSTASFIDMDPAELFSMRWTAEDAGFDFGLPCAGECSPLLVSAGELLPCEPSGIARDGCSAYADASAGSSPVFHSAQSTPASVISSSRRTGAKPRAPLLATRRLLLRYLRFLVPLCRKARALRVLAPRSRAPAATSARRSTSGAAEYWCHGNADTAVRDAILHCKKSLTARAEC
ncbi:probable membrane-associated kinase regulator 6 [Phragmites australis]|uniref:probable membrane-associated kinase regulator 6 n=1 Tax=Phragmites australis TaxID=29695 RepID=UPI002D79BFDF|nr:probable membrane-associated kinase regulator 6 [Phragmites australis]